MRLIPDTHAVLWLLAGDARMSERARRLMDSGRHTVLLSPVVALEISIKTPLGKLDAPDDVMSLLLGAGASELPVTLAHAEAVKHLPLHHRDPFDRLLLAQAIVEDAVILSADTAFDAYPVRRRW